MTAAREEPGKVYPASVLLREVKRLQTLDEDVCTLREENSSLTKHVERLTCDNDAKCLTEQSLTEQLLTQGQENQRLTELVDRLTHCSQAQLLQNVAWFAGSRKTQFDLCS